MMSYLFSIFCAGGFLLSWLLVAGRFGNVGASSGSGRVGSRSDRHSKNTISLNQQKLQQKLANLCYFAVVL